MAIEGSEQPSNGTRKITRKVGELREVDVLRVSLVDKGANRVPFRLTKRDSSNESTEEESRVLNFRGMFQKSSQPAVATVAAIAVNPNVVVEKAAELVKRAGFSVENVVKGAEGETLFLQIDAKDIDEGACSFYKMDGDYAAALMGATDLQKAASSDFNSNLGAQQFIPGLYMANDALMKTVTEVLEEAEGKPQAAQAIKTAAEQHANFLGLLVDQIPDDVFKLEKILDESDAEPTQKSDSGKTGDAAATADASPENHPKGEEVTPQKSEADNSAADEPKSQSGTSDDDGKGKVSKGESDAQETILEAISKLSEKLDGVVARVGKVEGTAEEAKVIAQKSAKAESTVTQDPGGDPAPTLRLRGAAVQKRDSGGFVPLLDTAYGGVRD